MQQNAEILVILWIRGQACHQATFVHSQRSLTKSCSPRISPRVAILTSSYSGKKSNENLLKHSTSLPGQLFSLSQSWDQQAEAMGLTFIYRRRDAKGNIATRKTTKCTAVSGGIASNGILPTPLCFSSLLFCQRQENFAWNKNILCCNLKHSLSTDPLSCVHLL